MNDEEYLEAVLDLVEQIPPGRVMTYGAVAEVVRERLGRGGPRQVGRVMSLAGGGVPWWRVVRASGEPAACHEREALALLRGEGCPLSDDGRPARTDARVVLRRALWWPDDEPDEGERDAAEDPAAARDQDTIGGPGDAARSPGPTSEDPGDAADVRRGRAGS